MNRKTENEIIYSELAGNLSNSMDLWNGGINIDFALIKVN